MDDLKKKKTDGKRIALGQRHERNYLKKIAKAQLDKLKIQEGRVVWGMGEKEGCFPCSKAQLIRVCKALIKYLERDKR